MPASDGFAEACVDCSGAVMETSKSKPFIARVGEIPGVVIAGRRNPEARRLRIALPAMTARRRMGEPL
jgi:hypothetical protein